MKSNIGLCHLFLFSNYKSFYFNVLNLIAKNLISGSNEILWDVTNNEGSKIDDRFYFITIVSDNISETKKVVVLRN